MRAFNHHNSVVSGGEQKDCLVASFLGSQEFSTNSLKFCRMSETQRVGAFDFHYVLSDQHIWKVEVFLTLFVFPLYRRQSVFSSNRDSVWVDAFINKPAQRFVFVTSNHKFLSLDHYLFKKPGRPLLLFSYAMTLQWTSYTIVSQESLFPFSLSLRSYACKELSSCITRNKGGCTVSGVVCFKCLLPQRCRLHRPKHPVSVLHGSCKLSFDLRVLHRVRHAVSALHSLLTLRASQLLSMFQAARGEVTSDKINESGWGTTHLASVTSAVHLYIYTLSKRRIFLQPVQHFGILLSHLDFKVAKMTTLFDKLYDLCRKHEEAPYVVTSTSCLKLR